MGVQAECEELQRIKEAFVETTAEEPPDESVTTTEDKQIRQHAAKEALEVSTSISPCIDEPLHTKDAVKEAVQSFKEIENTMEKETTAADDKPDEGGMPDESSSDGAVGDVKLKKAIDRLKGRVESMVGKIETQLTD